MRMATLWSLLPVKYCMAAPKRLGGSARTSTCRPSRPTLALALFSPRASTSSTRGYATKRVQRAGCGGPGHQQVEIAHRLAPAPQAAGGGDRLDARHLAQHVGRARRRRRRHSSAGSARCAGGTAAMERSTFSSSLAPMRGRSRSFCSWQSRSSSSMVPMRKCSKMSAMLLGPRPWILRNSSARGRELLPAAGRGARRSRVRRFPRAPRPGPCRCRGCR